MRALWVDAGNDPDWEKVERERMTALYFDIRDLRITKEYLKSVQARGYAPGVYAAWNWPEYKNLSPQQMAEKLAADVEDISWQRASGPKVQWNDERHEFFEIVQVLERYRKLQPYRDLSWTLEGMQGGIMPAEFITRLLKCKVRVVPQAYNGAMTQVWDALAVARDLVKRGVPDPLISPFYDAKHLPHYWDGFAFTQGRLP